MIRERLQKNTLTTRKPFFLIIKGILRENQIHAKVYFVIPIEKQILSDLSNRFPFLDRTSQRQDMEKNI